MKTTGLFKGLGGPAALLALLHGAPALALPPADICGAPYVLPSNQWRQIAIPCLPTGADNRLSTVFGDDMPGVNGTNWALFSFDPASNSYHRVADSESLQVGVGYWALQTSGGPVTLDMPDASSATPTTSPTTRCSTAGGCVDVPVASRANAVQWQMPGFPFPSASNVDEFRVAAAGCASPDGCTLAEAAANGVLHDAFWHYNGSGYTTLGSGNSITPWTGFWAAALNNAASASPRLLMPTGQGASGQFTVVAANDLGMHCADLDHQVFSILPPFNVVHAQVVEKGATPRIVDDAAVDVRYSAAANPNDPAGAGSINTTSSTALAGLFKMNFWDRNAAGDATIGGLAYGTLYPGVQVLHLLGGPDLTSSCDNPAIPAGCPSALSLFDPLPEDTGIPVPDANALFPEAGAAKLVTTQQKMPGASNTPQDFLRFDRDLPFFVNFDFGFRKRGVNWFAADGIPMTPVDDAGRRNPYPLMKIAAHDKTSGQSLASVDVVLPIAAEADCQNCHAEPLDCFDSGLPPEFRSNECLGAALDPARFQVMTLDDNPPGPNRLEQLRNAAKINILRLHDAKHGADYKNFDASGNLVARPCDPKADPNSPNCLANQTPIQCSRCHYSPALDLAQAGPVNEPEQGAQGRQQVLHASMSQVMHRFHGLLPPFNGKALFPAMPGPVGRSDAVKQDVLNKTCYQCHPGRLTKCLRGAMGAGGVVCQDCHGDMEQVGTDFTLKVNTANPGDFVLDGSLRVPWASEPKCQSCHTGDAFTPNHPANAVVAPDGIRLLQAYETRLLNVPGVPQAARVAAINASPNSRFAENQTVNAKGVTTDVLYRLSKGHGGVMCEGCHGSTHAIYPNPNPNANDNVASTQLQGHRGTVTECSVCHTDGSLGVTLDGPHGMHPVGGGRFADGGHEDLAERNSNACRACHGANGEGSPLSRVATDRGFTIEECEGGTLCPGRETRNFQVNLSKGTEVTCTMCHENKLSGGGGGDGGGDGEDDD